MRGFVGTAVAILTIALVTWYAAGEKGRAEDAYEWEMARLFLRTIETEHREPGFEDLYGVDGRVWTAQEAYEAALRVTPPPWKASDHARRVEGIRAFAELQDGLEGMRAALGD